MALLDQIPAAKTISPAKHAALAFLNAGLVLGVSLTTDYPGGVWKKISFRTRGMMDAVQAALAGVGPILFGFAREPEAKPFYTQAVSEVGVIAATDWNAGRTDMTVMSVA